MFRFLHKILVVFALGLVCLVRADPALAKANKYASIIVDADSLEILHARKIDDQRYPASLTKMMTLYLTFDALENGQVHLREPLDISARAARTPAVKLGLKSGRTITVEQAILALSVRSANDAAIVLAERLGGSTEEFANKMTAKANALGMRSTIFKNPHGLPDAGQITTARDMAKLAQALLQNHAKYYSYFSKETFTFQGRTFKNHNSLLGHVQGVDGFKTGFTNASGYNLVLSAKRDGRRIIAVVLGGASGNSRDTHMEDLIERGFDVVRQNDAQIYHPDLALNADSNPTYTRREALPIPRQLQKNVILASYTQPVKNWSVQVGAFTRQDIAQNIAQNMKASPEMNLGDARIQILPVQKRDGVIYRARLTGLAHQKANSLCKTLAQSGHSCLVISPS